MPAKHPAVGREVRMEPKDWGDGFVKDVAAGGALAVPDVGYYTATTTAVDGRARMPVSLELREFEPVEVEQRKLDFVRPRLILQADEDCWKVLPGKGAPKRLRIIPAPHLRQTAAAHVDGTR